MKKINLFVMVLVCIMTLTLAVPVIAQESANEVQPRYAYTSLVVAGLDFSGGKAYCDGSVTPSGNYSVSVTVSLYRQNGSSWDFVTSWSGSSTGGKTAGAGGSVNVGSGTYKVVTRGNVGNGMEYPTKSVIRTK